MPRTRHHLAAPLFALIAAGCGGGSMKVNTARMQAIHKIALVGVCTKPTFPGTAGLSTTFEARWGDKILPSEAAAFEATLPAAWKRVEIVPLSQVVGRADLPKGSGDDLCFGGLDPLTPKHRPDAALMKQLADALQVDGVMALWVSPTVRSGGSTAHIETWEEVAYVVDRSGAVVATVKAKGARSAEVEKLLGVGLVGTRIRKMGEGEFEALGKSYGQDLAARLGAVLSGT